jgi:hypothetical protein
MTPTACESTMPVRLESNASVSKARAPLSSVAVGSNSIEPSGISAQQTATTKVRIGTLASRSAKHDALTVAWRERSEKWGGGIGDARTAKEEPFGSTV